MQPVRLLPVEATCRAIVLRPQFPSARRPELPSTYLLNDYGLTRYALIPTVLETQLVYANTPQLQGLIDKARHQHPQQGLNLTHFGPIEPDALNSAYLAFTLAGYSFMTCWHDAITGQSHVRGDHAPPDPQEQRGAGRVIPLPGMTHQHAVMTTPPQHAP